MVGVQLYKIGDKKFYDTYLFHEFNVDTQGQFENQRIYQMGFDEFN